MSTLKAEITRGTRTGVPHVTLPLYQRTIGPRKALPTNLTYSVATPLLPIRHKIESQGRFPAFLSPFLWR